MARRAKFNWKRFVGNKGTTEVHDLDNEDTAANGCQIDEIREWKTFDPDTLAQAKSEGYDPCDKCLPGSQR